MIISFPTIEIVLSQVPFSLLLFPLLNPSFFVITNAYNFLHVIATLLAALSISTKMELLCISLTEVLILYRNQTIDLQSKLAITSQSSSAELTFLRIILVLRLLIVAYFFIH